MHNTNKTPGNVENKGNTDQGPLSYGQNVFSQPEVYLTTVTAIH